MLTCTCPAGIRAELLPDGLVAADFAAASCFRRRISVTSRLIVAHVTGAIRLKERLGKPIRNTDRVSVPNPRG